MALLFSSSDLQRGTAELLILAMLRDRPMYGYEIIREIRDRSDGYFQLEEGLLYPTLHRLEREGLARGEWSTVSGRRRRYYALTDAGLETLKSATEAWESFATRLSRLISPVLGGRNVSVE